MLQNKCRINLEKLNLMDIKRSFLFVEDENGELYRVAQSQDKQNQALRLLAQLDDHGELPVLRDRHQVVAAIDEGKLEKLASKNREASG
jgi:hypothetical protein